MVRIGNDWDALLKDEWEKPYYKALRSFLLEEYKNETIYPPAADIFNAFKITPYEDVRVVILGQDPYHEPGQAQGLAFSVPAGVTLPPSLQNIFKELESDVVAAAGEAGARAGARGAAGDGAGIGDGSAEAGVCRHSVSSEDVAADAVLRPWAEQGVLLLNTVLTVRSHRAASHKGRGWEQFTDRVIELLAEREKPMVFVLWGANAIAKKELIASAASRAASLNPARHLIITAPHPSPLSAYRGFFGGRYFSRCNYFLQDNGMPPINWKIEI